MLSSGDFAGQLDGKSSSEYNSARNTKREVSLNPFVGWEYLDSTYAHPYYSNSDWPNGKVSCVEYPGDFVLDLYDENIAYVPIIANSGSSGVIKLNMLAPVDEIETHEDYKNTYAILGSSATRYAPEMRNKSVLPMVGLDTSSVIIADGTVVYKYNKELTAVQNTWTSDETTHTYLNGWSFSVGGPILGMSVSPSYNGQTRVYLLHNSSNGGPNCTVLDASTLEQVDQKMFSSFGMGGLFIEDAMAGSHIHHKFDCNGTIWTYIGNHGDFYSLVYGKLNEDGLFYDNASWYSPWEDVIGVNVPLSVAGQTTSLDYNNTSSIVTVPTGIKLFGNTAVFWSQPGYSWLYGYSVGGLDFNSMITNENRSVYCSSLNLDKFLQFDYFGPNTMKGQSTTSVLPASEKHDAATFTTVVNPYSYNTTTGKGFVDDTVNKNIIQNSPVFNPYLGSSDDKTSPDVVGFGTPAMIGTTLMIPYFNGSIRNGGTYEFNSSAIINYTVGMSGLSFLGVTETPSMEIVTNLKYDGKYLWKLSLGKDNKMFISRTTI